MWEWTTCLAASQDHRFLSPLVPAGAVAQSTVAAFLTIGDQARVASVAPCNPLFRRELSVPVRQPEGSAVALLLGVRGEHDAPGHDEVLHVNASRRDGAVDRTAGHPGRFPGHAP